MADDADALLLQLQLKKHALHLAVWDDDANRLQALLLTKEHDLEFVDKNGNTPLLLAYRLGRTKLARMLLAAGSFPKARTVEGFEAVQVAALTANTDLTREAVLAYLAESDNAFARRLPGLQTALKELPDFVLRMSWEFSSWVPLLGRLLPSDTFYISKRGSSLRLDSTLLGMNGLTWERGSISLILWGDDMPVPGQMYVLDNEDKTAADARMAFTHPQDTHIQDWVRKLMTQKQKSTDVWSRDVVMQPELKKGLLGSLSSGFSKLAFGDSTPRGRVSEAGAASPGGTSAGAAAAAAAGGSTPGTPSTPSSGGFTMAAPEHVDDPRQVKQDIGIWSDCSVYEMRNFCVRDLVHAPVLPELKLKDWWKPEYSRQATAADVEAIATAAKGTRPAPVAAAAAAADGSAAAAPATGGAGTSTPSATTTSSSSVATDEAPELRLRPLFRALQAIRAGKINEKNATSATLEELEGMGFGSGAPGDAGRVIASQTLQSTTFAEYFGFDRPKATEEEVAAAAAAAGAALTAAASAAASAGASAAGAAAELSSADMVVPPAFIAPDGFKHKASAVTAVTKKENVTTEDKSMDLKVIFSKTFPIDVTKFLPVAEMMARTSRHAENFRSFFQSKFPAGAGFPVRFTIPVFPTITATITFEHVDVRRPPPKTAFEIPADYKMGAYVEKGWVRQL